MPKTRKAVKFSFQHNFKIKFETNVTKQKRITGNDTSNDNYILFLFFCFWSLLCAGVYVRACSGLSKFAKLARSVTRSRQFAAHIPNLKDPSKQSNLAQVRKALKSTIDLWRNLITSLYAWKFLIFLTDDVIDRRRTATISTVNIFFWFFRTKQKFPMSAHVKKWMLSFQFPGKHQKHRHIFYCTIVHLKQFGIGWYYV